MAEILVVDDEPAVRWLLRDIAELEGHQVQEAADGIDALAALAEAKPDLIILDVMMPGVSGIEVLLKIREMPGYQEIPVLMLTAAGDDATTWAGWSAGANCYMTKPFEPDHLVGWMERLLAGEGSANGSVNEAANEAWFAALSRVVDAS